MEQIRHIIDGAEVDSASGARFHSVDPWTQQPWAEVALGDAEDAARAVTAARRAFDEGPWPRMGRTERSAILHRLGDLMHEHADELALADTTDMGKPLADMTKKDIPRSVLN